MMIPKQAAFAKLAELIHNAKSSVSPETVTPESALVNDLALDSLDILQLSRDITRNFGEHFELEIWSQGPGTVQSIIDQLYAAEAACEGVAAPAA